MALFKIKTGVHYDQDPEVVLTPDNPGAKHAKKAYKEGDTIESIRPLDEIYANKFEKIVPGVNAPVVVTAERKAAVEALIVAGSAPEEDREFLENLQDTDYARMTRYLAPKLNIGTPKRGRGINLGEDVTMDFVNAGPANLKVFVNAAGKYQVTKATVPSKPLNHEPLDADKVSEFIEGLGQE